MEFNEYPAFYQVLRRMGGVDPRIDPLEFYKTLSKEEVALGFLHGDSAHLGTCVNQQIAEGRWYQEGRPYYSVWPKVAPFLAKTDLGKVPVSAIKLPYQVMLFRFAKDTTFGVQDKDRFYPLKSVLVSIDRDAESGQPCLIMWLDMDEMYEQTVNWFTFKKIPLDREMSVDEAMGSLPDHESAEQGLNVPGAFVREVASIIISCCLLSTDAADELISPDILAKDRQAWELADANKRQQIEQRAQRRGKLGWDIGRHIEMSPHIRSPHMALFWTGEGRRVPVVKLRKGSVIHKDMVTKLPTGLIDKDES